MVKTKREDEVRNILTRQGTYCMGDKGKGTRRMTGTTLQIARHAEFRMKMVPRRRPLSRFRQTNTPFR